MKPWAKNENLRLEMVDIHGKCVNIWEGNASQVCNGLKSWLKTELILPETDEEFTLHLKKGE